MNLETELAVTFCAERGMSLSVCINAYCIYRGESCNAYCVSLSIDLMAEKGLSMSLNALEYSM